jgi:hypothetical protein
LTAKAVALTPPGDGRERARACRRNRAFGNFSVARFSGRAGAKIEQTGPDHNARAPEKMVKSLDLWAPRHGTTGSAALRARIEEAMDAGDLPDLAPPG